MASANDALETRRSVGQRGKRCDRRGRRKTDPAVNNGYGGEERSCRAKCDKESFNPPYNTVAWERRGERERERRRRREREREEEEERGGEGERGME